jgi:hypothetical protein
MHHPKESAGAQDAREAEERRRGLPSQSLATWGVDSTDSVKDYADGGFIGGTPSSIISAARTVVVGGVTVKDNAAIRGLPVAGYKPTQSVEAVELVNEGKQLQERVLRYLDRLAAANDPTANVRTPAYDGRAVAISRTHVEIAFTLAARAVFQPAGVPRIPLPEDSE